MVDFIDDVLKAENSLNCQGYLSYAMGDVGVWTTLFAWVLQVLFVFS